MNKSVLSDHKKKGQRFIPPVLAAIALHETSYVNQLLPEILWLGLLKVQIGNSKAIDLALEFMKLTANCVESGDFRNFALIGKFDELEESAKCTLAENVAESPNGDELVKLLQPLLYNYPACPLHFLKPNEQVDDRSESLVVMKQVVELHINRNSYDAAVVQAMTAFIRQEMGGLHYSSRVEKPDFSSFIRSHEPTDWNHIGARARSAAQLELMPMGQPISDKWPRDFWNTGALISECILNDK